MAKNDNELLQELKKISEQLAQQERRIEELEDRRKPRSHSTSFPADEYITLYSRAFKGVKFLRFMRGSFLVWGIVLFVLGLSSVSADYSKTEKISGALLVIASIIMYWYSKKNAQDKDF